MTTASRSLATALWSARFASGLPRPRYTTNWDTTLGDVLRTGEHQIGSRRRAPAAHHKILGVYAPSTSGTPAGDAA